MARRLLITEATLVNEGRCYTADLLTEGERILRIDSHISDSRAVTLPAKGRYLLPGLIDTHVHFREPGYPEKGNLATESAAAVAGGVTSFLEMPNTLPSTTTLSLLEDKYRRAAGRSRANYGFYIGATEDNIEELLRIPAGVACGLKVFMGSSTGSMLVENEHILARIFSEVPMVVAVHCEEEALIGTASSQQDKEPLQASDHPRLRPRAACLASTQKALRLARKYGTRLHVLHVSTAEELELFEATALQRKRITAEGCLQQLIFCDEDYAQLGNRIKVNPAIKTAADRAAIWTALLEDRLDILGSDHAPHMLAEKELPYELAPSGAPMVQYALYALLEAWARERISIEKIVEKYCHNPALRFCIQDRGFLTEGYYADMVVVEKVESWVLRTEHVLSHCAWSPLEGREFRHRVGEVVVNGCRVVEDGQLKQAPLPAQRLRFHLT